MTTRRIIATFVPQTWVGDYAVAVDCKGDPDFDVTDLVVALGKKKALSLRDDTVETDWLKRASTAHEWFDDHDGPFYIAVQDSIEDYYSGTVWHCPRCGNNDVIEIGNWNAQSTLESDNTATITEYQCIDCDNISFFV